MRRKVYINESQLHVIEESRMTFFRFFYSVKEFIKNLLQDPVGARPSELLTSNGFGNESLRQALIDDGIIVRKETIDEPNGEDWKPHSMYHISYKVPKTDFKKKIRKLYKDNFKDEERIRK